VPDWPSPVLAGKRVKDDLVRTPRDPGVADAVAAARRGDARSVGRLISAVENSSSALPMIMAALAPHTGATLTVGLTGSPGVGKSTTTATLVALLREKGRRVAVLAVDPSSPFTGGALLGDRVRMQQHALDAGVYIRSMATRGHLGGLAVAAPQAVRVLDASGFDVVLIETVGVGQSEVEVAGLADVTAVILAPGMGDGIQAAKAGILEVGDVFVVNKSDRDGTQPLIRELRSMIALGARPADGWKPPIVATVASQNEGIEELWAAIESCQAHQQATGEADRRRRTRVRREVEDLVLLGLRTDLLRDRAQLLDEAVTAVMAGDLDPYAAARLVKDPSVTDSAGSSDLV
jgi:LAO/AO transport system kinase